MIDKSALMPGVSRREVWAWSAFDFANSGYTTVVLTAVFNAYFVSVVAADAPWATFLWTLIIAVSNAVGIFVMPAVGAIADASAQKKALAFRGDGDLHSRHCRTRLLRTGNDCSGGRDGDSFEPWLQRRRNP